MVRKVLPKVKDEQLKKDLEKYRQRAIELGLTDAKIITTDRIIIDERVRAKCLYPVCNNYGCTPFCSRNAVDLDFMREAVKRYRYGVFTMLKVPAELIAGPEAGEKLLSIPYQRKNWKCIAKLEAEVIADGYHQAFGLANASCKLLFCLDKECAALKTGKPCSYAIAARISMEGTGMDCYGMAARAGWDIYPIGRSTPPSEVAHGVQLGLILVY